MYPPVDPVIVQLGPLTLRWYGVLIMAGVMLAAWVGSRHIERRGLDRDSVWDLLLWVLIPGLIGARLYYVFIQSPRGPEGLGRFLSNPASILAVWEGGLHIFGGFIFGALGLWAFAHLRKAPLLVYADAIALGLPLPWARQLDDGQTSSTRSFMGRRRPCRGGCVSTPNIVLVHTEI